MEQSFSHWHYPKVIHQYFKDRARSRATAVEISRNFRKLHPVAKEPARSAEWIVAQSGLPWLPLDVSFPASTMLSEARRLKARFVSHRGDESNKVTYAGKGWRALSLHGISEYATSDAVTYGVAKEEEAPHRWTEAAKLCPTTTAFLKNVLPHGDYYRVRFLCLEPGAFLLPHIDRTEHRLQEMYLALNHPKGCYFKFKGIGYVPQKAEHAMIINVANNHAVINASEEDRFHVVIIGKHAHNKKWQAMIQRSYDTFLRGRIH